MGISHNMNRYARQDYQGLSFGEDTRYGVTQQDCGLRERHLLR